MVMTGSSTGRLTMREWQDRVHITARDKGWWDDENRNIPEILCLIHSEISEALEEYRKDKPLVYEEDGKPEGLGIELADAMIRIFDLLAWLELDPEYLIQTKHRYNETRGYRHGGKRA